MAAYQRSRLCRPGKKPTFSQRYALSYQRGYTVAVQTSA